MTRSRTLLIALVWAAIAACSPAESIDASRDASVLSALPYLPGPPLERASSADPRGANADFRELPPGEVLVIFDRSGPGCIRRLWCTLATKEEHHLRKIVLRMYWDGETEPSVNVPLGDFFGLGHATYYHYASLPMAAAIGKGMICFLPMPFASGARIEVENQGSELVRKFYWNVDYEVYESAPTSDWGRLHACFNRENPTEAKPGSGPEENYVLLDATGRGRYLGCMLAVQSLNPHTWWGEGDEVLKADGRVLRGTGIEDYFCCAWQFTQPFSAETFGVPLVAPLKDPERVVAYRWHIEDPVRFEETIHVSMEHGSQNDRSDDWSSVAYWYQTEPHAPFGILPVEDRLPRPFEAEAAAGAESQPAIAPTPTVEQPKPRIIVAAPDEEPATPPEIAALEIVLLTVWLPVALVCAGRWLLRRVRPTTPPTERS